MLSPSINQLPVLEFQYGSDVSFEAVREDSDDNPIDVTGWTVTAHFEYNGRTLSAATATVTMSDPTNGTVTVDVSHTSVSELSTKAGTILHLTWINTLTKRKVNRYKILVA